MSLVGARSIVTAQTGHPHGEDSTFQTAAIVFYRHAVNR